MASGEMMRQESLRHASIPCSPLDDELYDEPCYKVESMGAIITLNSCVSLLYSIAQGYHQMGLYFKPHPRCVIDREMGTCTLQLHISCPLQTIIRVQGNSKILRQLACLEACKELVPDIVEEEAINKELGQGSSVLMKYWHLTGTLIGGDAFKFNLIIIQLFQKFQVSVFRILRDDDLSTVQDALAAVQLPIGSAVSDYLCSHLWVQPLSQIGNV